MTREEPLAAEGPSLREGELPNSPRALSQAMFWQVATIGAFAPLLPVYLIGMGVTASSIAFIWAVNAFVALVIGQVVGYIADTAISRTRFLMYMSLGGAAVAAAFPLLPPRLGWLCAGIAAVSIFMSQRHSIFSALVLASHRGEELFGPIRTLGSIGFVVVTLTVGWMADQPAFTPAIMWPALVVIDLLIVLSTLPLVDDDPKVRMARHAARLSFFRAQRLLLSNKLLRRFLLFTFLTQLIHAPAHSSQFVFLRNLGSSSLFITFAVTVAATSEMIVLWWGAQLLRRFRLPTIFALIPLALALRFGAVFLFPSPITVLLSNTLHIITFGAAYLSGVIFANREAPPELRSSAQTIFGLVFSVLSALGGNLISAWVLKVLTERFRLTDTEALISWYGMAVMALIFATISLIPLVREYDRRYPAGA